MNECEEFVQWEIGVVVGAAWNISLMRTELIDSCVLLRNAIENQDCAIY